MPNDDRFAPLLYPGVMVSSTFTDLRAHRDALIDTIQRQEMKPVVMEYDAAKPGVDVLESSLLKVREASAYVGVISHKYGQVPQCSKRNPDGLSLTELEFNEARHLGRPILLFIMSPDHDVKAADVETDPEKKKKLDTFRENAKRFRTHSDVQGVYAEFNSLEDFRYRAMQSVAELRRHLAQPSREGTGIPAPPAFYAEPPYIGSHQFVGRKTQLEALSAWARPQDRHPVLLFDAIGGTGKSMLTWEWATNHASEVRSDWAGQFWYSFYERGAVMSDFCRHALAYITRRPYEEFRKQKTRELAEQLLRHLRNRPWLFILDGLERVLVAYQRSDAAQITDEEAGNATDQIASRDSCDAIRDEDDDLLRHLSNAAPSKLLLTSRLVPRVLLNQSGQAIPGVLHLPLPGLDPADAEALVRSCGVTGSSTEIQTYLDRHCDCHPLVSGIVAGLVNDYLPDRGNFDAWANDPEAGAHLNLADLDLVQKRNHILKAALRALPEKSAELLSTLALLSEAVDYETLRAFNPHLPPEPKHVEAPKHPAKAWSTWDRFTANDKERYLASYEKELQAHQEYAREHKAWRESEEVRTAPDNFARTIRDLERRGLMQYDAQAKRYDVHPVVRAVAAGGLRHEEKQVYGQKVVDHFVQKAQNPYQDTLTLEDVAIGLRIVRTLLQMGRYPNAYDHYMGDLSDALYFNLEAYPEALSILRAFFPGSWTQWPTVVSQHSAKMLANDAAFALSAVGALREAASVYDTILGAAAREDRWRDAWLYLVGTAVVFERENRLELEERCLRRATDLAAVVSENDAQFVTLLWRFHQLSRSGQWKDAVAVWQRLEPMGRKWSRSYYRAGTAECRYAWYRYWQGTLAEDHLTVAETIAHEAKSRVILRELHGLRGEWRLSLREWDLAAASLQEAVRMARESGRPDGRAEAQLALAKLHLKQLSDPQQYTEQLLGATDAPAQLPLAHLWLALGARERAGMHALAAHRWAWADGEPYVRRHELGESRKLLKRLRIPVPKLPPHDPRKDRKFPWQDALDAAIKEETRRAFALQSFRDSLKGRSAG